MRTVRPDGMTPAEEVGGLFLAAATGRKDPWMLHPTVGQHIYLYIWWVGEESTTDTLTVVTRDHAYAERVNNQDELVWRAGPAPLGEVIKALQELADPGTPNAPTQVLRKGTPNPM